MFSKTPTSSQTSFPYILLSFSITCFIFIWIYKQYTLPEKTNNRLIQDYHLFQNRLTSSRLSLETKWQDNQSNFPRYQKEAEALLLNNLTDSIFPYWYGTPWDFNGTTEIPQHGKIACGYFVTTTLQHLGFNIPRVQLAQQAASVIIKSLCPKERIKIFGQKAKFQRYIKTQTDGCYLLGLDTHIGYLVKEANQLYFIHASRSGKNQVLKEKFEESRVISKSKIFYVGQLFHDAPIIEKWLKYTPIKLVK